MGGKKAQDLCISPPRFLVFLRFPFSPLLLTCLSPVCMCTEVRGQLAGAGSPSPPRGSLSSDSVFNLVGSTYPLSCLSTRFKHSLILTKSVYPHRQCVCTYIDIHMCNFWAICSKLSYNGPSFPRFLYTRRNSTTLGHNRAWKTNEELNIGSTLSLDLS